MRYPVRFEDETKEYSVVDRLQSMDVLESHPALKVAHERAAEANEQWRKYTHGLGA